MAGTWTSERFPQFEPAVRRLTEQHRELEDEPLHLAVSYAPPRNQQDIFLLEVIGAMNAETTKLDREWFETTFTATSGFPMQPNQRLHLILTNPEEFEAAVREHWPSAREFLNAIRWGDYQVLFADRVGKRIIKPIESAQRRREGAAGG